MLNPPCTETTPALEQLIDAMHAVKFKHPEFGSKRVLKEVKKQHPQWQLSEKRMKKHMRAQGLMVEEDGGNQENDPHHQSRTQSRRDKKKRSEGMPAFSLSFLFTLRFLNVRNRSKSRTRGVLQENNATPTKSRAPTVPLVAHTREVNSTVTVWFFDRPILTLPSYAHKENADTKDTSLAGTIITTTTQLLLLWPTLTTYRHSPQKKQNRRRWPSM
jgi:hypothetical protein